MQMQKSLISYVMLILLLLLNTGAWAGDFYNKKSDDFLTVEKAFQLTKIGKTPSGDLMVDIHIADGYYLYKSKTRIRELEDNEYKLTLPEGKIKEDEYFGKQEVFHGDIRLQISFSNPSMMKLIPLEIQGCSEKGLCYPPTIKKIDYASAPLINVQEGLSESEGIASRLTNSTVILSLLGFFVSGLLLSLTPCVLPMLPILSGIILSSNNKNPKTLTIAYVLGVCLTYTTLGVIAGLTGNLLSSSLQNTNFIILSSFIFVLLAASMFDLIQLTLPKTFTNILSQSSQKIKGGNVIGVFFLGLISSLILSPCVAPPLAGAILFIGQTENTFLGGGSLLFMALGMSTPLILLGFTSMAFLPKPGPWMNEIKKGMAFILLAMALYIARPMMDDKIFFIGLMVLLISLSASVIRNPALRIMKRPRLILIFTFLIIASFLTKQIIGQFNLDPLSNQKTNFIAISSIEDLNQQLSLAEGKPVLLDFYADWCVACLEYEKHTFMDVNVKKSLDKFVLLKADVTANNPSHQLLLKKFNLYGPPGIIFYQNQQELNQYQIVGYKNPTDFIKVLTAVLNEGTP